MEIEKDTLNYIEECSNEFFNFLITVDFVMSVDFF